VIPIPRLLGIGTTVVSHLPRSLCYALAKAWGTLQYYQDSRRRGVVLLNLFHIMPWVTGSRRRALARKSFQVFAMNAVDFLLAPTLSRQAILSMAVPRDDELVDSLKGKGYVLLSGHLGNWDFATQWMWARGARGLVVAEAINQSGWYEVFRRYRGRRGLEVFPLDANPVSLLRGLRQGKVVILLGDRDLAGAGFEMGFFTGRRMFPRGPATLAARLGVPIMAGCVVRRNTRVTERKPYLARGYGLIQAEGRTEEDLNREVVARLARMIADYPDQWFVFSDEWLKDPEDRE